MVVSIGGNIFYTAFAQLQAFLTKFYGILSGEWQTMATLLVTLFVSIIGYRLIMGKYGEATKQMLGIVIAVPVVYAIAFSSTLFTDWFISPIFDTMFSLISLFLDTGGSDIKTAFANLDDIFGKIFVAVDQASKGVSGWDMMQQAKLFVVQLVLGLTFGALYVIFFVLLIMGIFALHVFFVIGSIPIFLAAFPDTRHIFWAWLKAVLNYALIPVFTAIVMSITLFFLDSAITSVSEINISEDGVFTPEIGQAIFIGIMSITFHLKAPEFAAALTGGQASGMSGFFGTVGSIGGGAALISQKMGATGAASSVGKWGLGYAGGVGDRALGGVPSKAFSALKGLAKND